MSSPLEEGFDAAMLDLYKRALSETGYKATRFLDMLHRHRGLETAGILINATRPSDGYTALWELNRLDLTVEALVFDHSECPPCSPRTTSKNAASDLPSIVTLAEYRYFGR